jgi:hypothetical protein
LDEADDVAVGVFDAGDQRAVADVLDRFVLLSAGGEEFLEAGADVLDLPVADGAGEAAGVAVGIEAEALIADVELDVVGCVDLRPGAEEGAVEGFRAIEILDGIDDGKDA